MKKKVKLANIPELNTVKEIILYGTEKGKDHKQFVFHDKKRVEHTKTFNMTWKDISGIAQYLYDNGVTDKKKIAFLSENSYEWIIGYYAVMVSGNVAVPLDSKLSAEDLAKQLINCHCDAIFYETEFSDVLEDIYKVEGMHKMQEFNFDSFSEYYEKGLESIAAGNTQGIDAEVKGEDMACIVYTSGTTGRSKGVMLSHKNLTSDAVASCRVLSGRHAIGFLPLNHTYSWVSALFSCYLLTEYGYICQSIKNIQNDMMKYNPYNFSGVPLAVETIYDRIWKTAKKQGREEILQKGIKISRLLMKFGIDRRRKLFKTVHDNLGGNLNMIICGGAALDPKHEQFFYDIGILIINGYGTTECSPAVTCNRLDNFRFGSVGLPLPCCEVKINEPNEEGVGEIYVRGENVMMGYYDDPEATASVFDGEWFKTGDFGRMDEDGFLYYVGRKKNLIVTKGGKNVSPEELEDKLVRFDYVKEVLVYEENDVIIGEFYLDTTEYPDAEEQLKKDMKEFNAKMPSFKKIGKTIVRDTEFPKTTTLKIRRKYNN